MADIDVVTGAFDYTGRYVTGRLLESGRTVKTLTGHPNRPSAANRSGRADLPESVEVIGANVADPAEAKRTCDGAAVVYHCANPPYAKWPDLHPPLMEAIIEAAAGASLVFGDNLYA